jgi:membrane-associated phospholipid phosphatase
VAILVVVFGWVMLILVPVVAAAICWARVILGDHTGRQVIAGAAVGALVAALVM